jgi:hypothetical protein
VGINNGVAAGQSVMWPHVHLIPRREGDTPNPKGGVRNVIPLKGNYEDTTEDDNSPRLKNEMKETRVVMGVCFGERDDTTEGEKDFDYSAIQYHGKTKNYKKQQPENET